MVGVFSGGSADVESGVSSTSSKCFPRTQVAAQVQSINILRLSE